jgi:excisionase family DNA binding protein
MTTRLLNASEAAERLGIHHTTLRRLHAAGRIPAIRYTPTTRSRILFHPNDLENLIQQSRRTPTSHPRRRREPHPLAPWDRAT